MITSINKSNSADYQKLYRAVEDYLKHHDEAGHADTVLDTDGVTKVANPEFVPPALMDEDTYISSLDQLFGHMKTLREKINRLTRLPLDEPFFVIDANTRKIDTTEFKKTGSVFAVEGDEIADSVYFIVDRFYDHVDLATQDVYIQYKNAKGDEKVCMPGLKDMESIPGKLIIEWPISSIVTASAGNVTFSVRFFTYDGTSLSADGTGKLVYSLSTLPSTMAVQSAQNFDLVSINEQETSKLEENEALMVARLVDSPIWGTSDQVAEKPVFWTSYSLPEAMNLGVDEDGFTSETVYIPVQAYNEDGGIISYSWTKKDLYTNAELPVTVEPKMVVTTDTAPVEGKVYYSATLDSNNSVVGYSMVGSLTAFEDGVQYYEKVSMAKIDSIGKYQAEAKNRVGNASATEITPNFTDLTGKKIEYCVVPDAEDPVMKDISSTLILEFDANKDNKYVGSLTDTSEVPDDNGNALTYQWYYSKDNSADSYVAIDGATNAKLDIAGASKYVKAEFTNEQGQTITMTDTEIQEALAAGEVDPEFVALISKGNGVAGKAMIEGVETDVVYSSDDDEETGLVSGDGYYKVEVTNNRNNTTASKETNVCRVTHSATKPDIKLNGNAFIDNNEQVVVTAKVATKLNGGLQVEPIDNLAQPTDFSNENRTAEDSYTYQWFRYSNGKDKETNDYAEQLVADSKLAAEGKYVVSGDYRVKSASASTPTLILTENDLKNDIYFCRVVNNYNGTKAVRCSRLFKVTGSLDEE